MAADNTATASATASTNSSSGVGKGKKRKYLPRGKPVKKGSYPLRPGVQGFFLTCDGGRERQATDEALNLLDIFYEQLVHGKNSSAVCRIGPTKPLNKIIKFEESDSSDAEDESPNRNASDGEKHVEESENLPAKKQHLDHEASKCEAADSDKSDKATDKSIEDLAAKKQHLDPDASKFGTSDSDKSDKATDKSIDDLIEEELEVLGDRNKRHFVSLDSGCNGCIFIQMPKRAGDPGPAGIVQHMISSAASTRKHMSRFILRVLPAEVTCYASEEEISKAIKPLIEQYFPTEAPTPQKFAVLYEARSNTGIERMTIINAVAKSVPQPHKVDLKSPDKTIVVQIVKTICLVGVVERYKELSKFNLRQLTSPQQ